LSKKSKANKKSAVKKERNETAWKNHLILKKVEPLTLNQCKVFEEYEKGKNLVLHGIAGSGKTYLALYLAMKEMEYNPKKYHQVVIFRSVVPGRSAGFLPGTLTEKASIFEDPYHQLFGKLYNRDDAYTILKQKGIVHFLTTSYVRGITLDNSIIIIDEFQNLINSELNSVITRTGIDSKLILCGDIVQNDLQKFEKTAVNDYLKIFNSMKSFSAVEFNIDDVVRGGLCREYILARHKLEESEQCR
jgi:phosphate starvation-inducible PhoH-like protein/PhoH-like ATPase